MGRSPRRRNSPRRSSRSRDRHNRDKRGPTTRREETARPVASDEAAKSGRQKAKDAVEKEREKARLKRLDRENTQKEREEHAQKEKERRREDDGAAVTETVEASAALAAAEKRSELHTLSIVAMSAAEQNAEASKALTAAEQAANAAVAIAESLSKRTAPPVSGEALGEGSVRKLFDLMDRNNKSQVSQRDVLVALRKHPAVRLLFGLPATNVEDGSSAIEARLLAIQDAFEAGAGLGEVAQVFDEIRAGCAGQTFSWEAFNVACTSVESIRQCAAAAVKVLPREHIHGPDFIATADWQVVPPGAACPGGLEYQMDMESGRTLARLPPKG